MKNRPVLQNVLFFLLGMAVAPLFLPSLFLWSPSLLFLFTPSLWLGPPLLFLMGITLLGFLLRKLSESIAFASFVLHLFPRSAQGYLQRGKLSLDQDAYSEAIADFSQAIRLRPGATAYTQRGIAYSSLPDYKKALADYEQAIILDPSFLLAYQGRASIRWQQKNYQQAIEDYQLLIEKTPPPAIASSASVDQGSCYMDLGKYQEAISCFDQAIALSPRYSRAYLYRGAASSYLRNYQQALQDVEVALHANRENALCYLWRALILLAIGEVAQARKDFMFACRKDRKNLVARWWLAWLDLLAGESDEQVRERLEIYATEQAGNHMALLCRGVAAWLRGNYELAANDLEQAAEDGQKLWSIAFWLGMTYAMLGRSEEASVALSRSQELGLPALFLPTLERLRSSKPDFFEQSILPLINKAEKRREM